MKQLGALTLRNMRLYFKDKGLFFVSLITPAVLLVLFVTFLGNIYKKSFLSALPPSILSGESLVDATVGGQLISSLLAVSCVTVAFCSNILMVQDRANGTINDLTVTPVKRPVIAASYFTACTLSTLIVNLAATGLCFLYLAKVGWYMSAGDTAALILDVVMLSLFGVALSSFIHFFLKTQGQASAVGTIVSAGYGFLCGAYMPISNFSDSLQKFMSFLPGTYGTSLLRNHAMAGVFREMKKIGFPAEIVESIRDSVDCNIYFFSNEVKTGAMYAVLCISVLVLLAAYIAANVLRAKRAA